MNGSRSPSGHLPLSDELAGVVARMSGLLLSEETVETALSVLSVLAQETVPGSSGAGVSLIDGRKRRSSGSTDARVQEADGLQYRFDEGPCLTAASTRELVRMDDLAQDRRWPRWAEAALALELRSAMSAPLIAGDRSLGAIKVYADEAGAFDARSEQLLMLFAAHAAILVANIQHRDQAQRLSSGMRAAFRDRDVVSMAKGVLMGRNGVDEDTAFGMIIGRSQQEGTTGVQTARAIVDSVVRRRR